MGFLERTDLNCTKAARDTALLKKVIEEGTPNEFIKKILNETEDELKNEALMILIFYEIKHYLSL
jgi:hypothetical protein